MYINGQTVPSASSAYVCSEERTWLVSALLLCSKRLRSLSGLPKLAAPYTVQICNAQWQFCALSTKAACQPILCCLEPHCGSCCMWLSQHQRQSVLSRKGRKLFFGGVTPVLQHRHNHTDAQQHKHNGREDISTLVSLSLGLVCPVLSLSCPLRRSRVLLTCADHSRQSNILALKQWRLRLLLQAKLKSRDHDYTCKQSLQTPRQVRNALLLVQIPWHAPSFQGSLQWTYFIMQLA